MTTRTSDWFIIQNTDSDWPQVIFFLDFITLQQQQNAETERLRVNSRAQLSNNVTMNELLHFSTEIVSINFRSRQFELDMDERVLPPKLVRHERAVLKGRGRKKICRILQRISALIYTLFCMKLSLILSNFFH